MKRRILIAIGVFVVSAICLIPILAPDTHALLLRDFRLLTWNPLIGWQMILSDARVRQFYLYYCAGLAMILIWTLVSGNYLKYRSDMQTITPDIQTPCPEGQGQFGSARWMPKREIGKHFTVWKVPIKVDWYRELIADGRKDFKEAENAQIDI